MAHDHYQNEIKAVSIPLHGYPLITRGTYAEITKAYFGNNNISHVSLNKSDYIIVSDYYFNRYNDINFLATNIYRSFRPAESYFQDLVYGPVVLLGKSSDGVFTSVSQQTIEAVLTVFERDSYGVPNVPQ